MSTMERMFRNGESRVEEARRTFIPAAGRDWALPLYDPLVKWIGGDRARAALLDLAPPHPGQVVLDVGCGTGSLAMLVKHRHPSVEVVGIDPDPKALARASRKASGAALEMRLDRGFADALPYGAASFDRVYSSFVYHHLGGGEKAAMLREARRVLRPGGVLCLLDFDGRNPSPRVEGRAGSTPAPRSPTATARASWAPCARRASLIRGAPVGGRWPLACSRTPASWARCQRRRRAMRTESARSPARIVAAARRTVPDGLASRRSMPVAASRVSCGSCARIGTGHQGPPAAFARSPR